MDMSSKGFLLTFIWWWWWLCWLSLNAQAATDKSKQQQEQQQQLQQQQQQKEKLATFWDTVPPGVLLQNLDALTADATSSFFHVVPAPKSPNGADGRLSTSIVPNAQAIVAKRITKRDTMHELLIGGSSSSAVASGNKIRDGEVLTDNKDAEITASTANVTAAAEASAITIPYDYDRAYEEFVKKYFDGSIVRDLTADNSNTADNSAPVTVEHVEKITNEYDNLREAESRTRKHKTKVCKTVKKGGQKCHICKNPRNGEKSESCSFNKESSPSKYAFKKKSKSSYHKKRSDSDEDDHDDDEDEQHDDYDDGNDQDGEDSTNTQDGKKSASTKSHAKAPIEEYYTKCLVRHFKHKICYRCENDDGDKLHKCYGQLSDKGYHHQKHYQPLHQKLQHHQSSSHHPRHHNKNPHHQHRNNDDDDDDNNNSSNHREKTSKNRQHKQKRTAKLRNAPIEKKDVTPPSSLSTTKQQQSEQKQRPSQLLQQAQQQQQPQQQQQQSQQAIQPATTTTIAHHFNDYAPRRRIIIKE